MGKVRYEIKVAKNEGLVISPSELLEQYFFGIPVKSKDGNVMPSSTLKTYIQQAQLQVENFLTLKLVKQQIEESFSFIQRDYQEWGFIQVTYPVVKPKSLFGFINDVRQILYPAEWLTAKQTNDGKSYQRRLYLVPGSQGARTNSIVYSGITPNLGLGGWNNIPDYWRVTYCTGYDKVPLDIISVVGKLAAVPILAILGDLLLGAGISAKSISIDGLSQSISTVASAKNSLYGARISELTRQLTEELKILNGVYVGIRFTAL